MVKLVGSGITGRSSTGGKTGMWQRGFIVLLVWGVMANDSLAEALFEESFTDSSAAARFDATESLGWVSSPVFAAGVVTLQEYSGGTTTMRTNVANNFEDNGSSGPVVYSVIMDRQDGNGGSAFNSLYARLGASGFADGYQVRYLCDSTDDGSYSYGGFAIFRVVGGVKTAMYSSGTITPAPVRFARTEMSLTLENRADAVDYSLVFGDVSYSGSDSSVDRVTSGVGVGVELLSSGGEYFIPTDYDDLAVATTTITCADLIADGLIINADLNKDCYVDLLDFAVIAQNWFRCANPQDIDCE